MNELYTKSNYKPKLVAPEGFFDQDWYTQLLQDSGSGIVDIVTHHIYNLGAVDMQPCFNADVTVFPLHAFSLYNLLHYR
jgi:hypothetical protein